MLRFEPKQTTADDSKRTRHRDTWQLSSGKELEKMNGLQHRTVCCLTILLVSCNYESMPSETRLDTGQEGQKLAETWLDAFSNNAHEDLHEIMSPDVVIYGLGGVESMTLDEMFAKLDKSAQRKNRSPYIDKRWMPISGNYSLFGGDGVLFWGTLILNLKNGISIRLPVHMATVVKDSKIVTMHFYYDVFKIIRKSGYKVLPPAGQ